MTYLLHKSAAGYALCDSRSARRPLTIDFDKLQTRVTRGGRELLARAVGARPGLRVVDSTAGLGTDSFILASRGCEVLMIERSNTLFLMLEEALERASMTAARDIVSRMTLKRGDACRILGTMATDPPDVIVIDPMFPSRTKAAQVKGDLQTLQGLLGKEQAVRGLIHKARATARERVVLKRPLRGGEIEGMSPSGSVRGKASRFDIFAPLSRPV